VVVQAKAKRVGAPLTVVPDLEQYEGGATLELGLAGQHQRSNAALAIRLAAAWEAQRARIGGATAEVAEAADRRAQMVAAGQLPPEYREGLRACHWPGRAQVHPLSLLVPSGVYIYIRDDPCRASSLRLCTTMPAVRMVLGGLRQVVEVPEEDDSDGLEKVGVRPKAPSRLSFYLDGAHTEESMATCATWFADAIGPTQGQTAAPTNGAALETQRVLLFNCMQVRWTPSRNLAICRLHSHLLKDYISEVV